MGRDPVGHERLDVRGQVTDGTPPSLTGELAEGEPDGHAAPDALRAVALGGEPGDVSLDFRRDPRAPKAIDRRRLDEVLLQHGNFLSACELEESSLSRGKRYVNRPGNGSAITPGTRPIFITSAT